MPLPSPKPGEEQEKRRLRPVITRGPYPTSGHPGRRLGLRAFSNMLFLFDVESDEHITGVRNLQVSAEFEEAVEVTATFLIQTIEGEEADDATTKPEAG